MMQAAANRATETNEELMARFQAGDMQAMEELFNRFQKPLFNFFYRMVGRRETAEDLVQETFLKLCRFGKSFRGSDAKFTTWLYSVAGNQCRDYLRHSSRRPETALSDLEQGDNEQNLELDDISPTTNNSPVEDNLLRLEIRSTIKSAIDSLPEKERLAIILREYQGLEYKEIAEVLNCPLGSVKVLIFRARQRLKQELKDLQVR
jgi:RNA polymerase sigma-70 factor (ECF subfamily)